MLYQRYFLRMNQSNTTHILALLLALVLALSCTHLAFTTLQLRRSSSLLLEIGQIGLDANATGGNLTTTTIKPPASTIPQIAPGSSRSSSNSSSPLPNFDTSASWPRGSDLKSAVNRDLADFDEDGNGPGWRQWQWRRQKRKHYRRLHKHRYKHKEHQQHRTRWGSDANYLLLWVLR